MAAALLRGEVPDGVPLFVRPFAAAYAAFARYAHRRGGRLGDAFAAGAPSDGMTWVRSVAPDATVPAGPPGTWSVEDVRRLPSCALRGAVEAARHRDLTRPWGRGTLADLLHLAFVGHVDVATVDKTTFALTEPVRRRLHGTAIFRNGKLDRVLDHLEHETEGRP